MSTQNQIAQYGDHNQNALNPPDQPPIMHIRKISSEQLQQLRKISHENPGHLRKISYERKIKDPIEILKLNKKTRTKDQFGILVDYFRQFQNLKIIKDESNYSEKISQFVDKWDFIFHTMDKNDFFYFVLKGEVSAYAKKSEKNLSRSSSPIYQQQMATQSTQSPKSQPGLEKNQSGSQFNSSQFIVVQQDQIDEIQQDYSNEDEVYSLLRKNNTKIGQYFENEGKGVPKYNRFQIYQEKQSFGDLSKKYKTFSVVAKSDEVEIIKIQNKDFTHIFDFLEKKLAMTILTLRKQFEGIVSDRILINLSYLFEEDGEVLNTGEYVYKENDIVNKVFLVKDGYLDLVKRVKNIKNKYVEKKISILSTGELFGYESLVQPPVKEDDKQNINDSDEQEESVAIEHYHKFSCKSTTENVSIYWLDLNMLRRHDDYEEFLNVLARKGEKKTLFYQERLQKVMQIEEKQHTDKSILQSPSKISDPRQSFKDAVQNLMGRSSSHVFDVGQSPSQHSLSNINDEIYSPVRRNKRGQSQIMSSVLDKLESNFQSAQLSRKQSLMQQSSRIFSEALSPESSPLRKNQTFNQLPYNQNQKQLFSEMIPEKDEDFTIANNQIKFNLSKIKNNSSQDDNKITLISQSSLLLSQQKLNQSRRSFSTTNEFGFQLKPIYNKNNNNQQQQQLIQGLGKLDSLNSPDRMRAISPFSSPIKIRTMRAYENYQNDGKAIKGVTSEKDNFSKNDQQQKQRQFQKQQSLQQFNFNQSQLRSESNNQIEDFYNQISNKALRIGSQDTPEEIEEQIKQQIQKKLKRQDSGRLLQRKREHEYNQNPSNIDINQVQQLIKLKEDMVQNQILPKNVQLVASGLQTFEESEKIQRLLKKSKTKIMNPNISMQALNNINSAQHNYSPRQLKNSNNQMNNTFHSNILNTSLTKLFKNKKHFGQRTFSELNESNLSLEKQASDVKKNNKSPMYIKSFSQFNVLDDDEAGNLPQSQLSILKQKSNFRRNSSPLNDQNIGDYFEGIENDSSQNLFKCNGESPKLKLQLHQASAEPSIDLHTFTQNTKQIINIQTTESDREEANQQNSKQDIIKNPPSKLSSLSQMNKTLSQHLQKQSLMLNLSNKPQVLTLQNQTSWFSKQDHPQPQKGQAFQRADDKNNLNNNSSSKMSFLQIHSIKGPTDDKNLKNITAKLQVATSGSPLKNINLINSIGLNRRYSQSGQQDQHNSKQKEQPKNVLPNFQNNKNNIELLISGNGDNQLYRNTRSSSGSQNKIEEPLALYPLKDEYSSGNSQNLSSANRSQRVHQTGEKMKRTTQIAFNQNLLKKSLVRQSLQKKYHQVISNSPYRDKIILVGEKNVLNEDLSNQQSLLLSGAINRQNACHSSQKLANKRLRLNDLNSNFVIDKSRVLPNSLENSRNASSSMLNSNIEPKINQTSIMNQNIKQRQQKTLIQAIRYNSVERLRNINSLHKIYTPERFDSKNISAQSQYTNVSNPITTSNTPDKKHLASIHSQTNQNIALPARQATLQNLHSLITSQKKQDSSISTNNQISQPGANKNMSIYSNIIKILKPINLAQVPRSEKKGFSLHSSS